MRFQGLVTLVLLTMVESSVAQQSAPPPPPADLDYLPPSPRKFDADIAEPSPLPPNATIVEPRSVANIETELQQFRSELREFQAIREEVARSTRSADSAADDVSARQHQELVELLAKLAKRSLMKKIGLPQPQSGAAPQNVQNTQPPLTGQSSTNPSDAADSLEIADPFQLGKVLFRQGDFVAAEKAFRKTPVTADNDITLKYLVATCLRRQSRWQAAAEAYKSVAESNQDPVLRDMAKWQLENIHWNQQTEAQLHQMRQHREKRIETPK
jgi:hypothetical protein